MPSKEHEALVEKVSAVLNEQEGCYFQPQDYHRGAAKEVLSTILAALQEPTEAMHSEGRTTVNYRDAWRAMLAASALGEQSE
ncbi:hypothetical protein [Brucella anthropi]|uniref:hypothetical protein n=1 Tax=Brucella anthropi TaxID=529 RepID=UPI001CFF1E08|nr:hypothetical protein [Brucella anthropi]